MMTRITLLEELKSTLVQNNSISQEVYNSFDVKRGLRNADGSGVLTGLTHICAVIGSKVQDGKSEAVDGELSYRGISIFDVVAACQNVDHFGFEKVSFLLLLGRWPNAEELKAFSRLLEESRSLPDAIVSHVIQGISSHNLMNKLQTSVSALYSEDDDPDTLDPLENLYKSMDLIAKVPTILAYSFLKEFSHNPSFLAPKEGMSTAEAFLYMLREGQPVSELEKSIFDLCLILHTEHGGGNNSTFAARVVTSSGTDIYSAIAAATASLKGPLHGAANIMVMDMMADIKQHVENWSDREEVRGYLKKIILKEAHDRSGKIYGLGHAVYTKSDPRATILKEQALKLAQEKGRMDELNLYFLIEEEGPKLFEELKGSDKVIAPNVDFFSGFVYDCLGIPTQLYTSLFAMARMSGWCSHRIEEILSGKRIIRPSYKFVK